MGICMKMKSFVRVVSILLGVMGSSCARHFYDFTWQAVVVDSQTGIPIPYCVVQADALFQANMDRSGKEQYVTQTDLYGNFSLLFRSGYEVHSRICAAGYHPYDWSSKRMREQLPAVIRLIRMAETHPDSLRIDGIEGYYNGIHAPFVGVQYQIADSLRPVLSGVVAFDFLNSCKVYHTDSADLWIEESANGYPVLRASKLGGICALSADSMTNAANLLSAEYAPAEGYVSKYHLTGREVCVFVKCRDGVHYARVRPEPKMCVKIYQTPSMPMKEIGFRFEYAFQSDLRQPRYFPEAVIREHSFVRQQKTLVNVSAQTRSHE